MKYDYVLVEYSEGLPVDIFLRSMSRFNLHRHNDIELNLVLKGSMNLNVGSSNYTLKEKEMIFINSNELHYVTSTHDECIFAVIHINTNYLESIYPGFRNLFFKCNHLFSDEISSFLGYCICKMICELDNKEKGYQFTIMSVVNELMAYLIKNFKYISKEDQNNLIDKNNVKKLEDILDYVNKHYSEKISLQKIAEERYINYFYLSHLFKDEAGISFKKYLNHIRLEKALEYLTDTQKKVTEIANSCGFSSANLLNKLFKEKHGFSISEYRRNISITSNKINQYSSYESNRKDPNVYLNFNKEEAINRALSYLNLYK